MTAEKKRQPQGPDQKLGPLLQFTRNETNVVPRPSTLSPVCGSAEYPRLENSMSPVQGPVLQWIRLINDDG